jgi:tripartite-type tricarboxylate transporter receptor subunit TctC
MTGLKFTGLRLAATVLATALLAGPLTGRCWAQDYPTRPIRIIVPFGAGGPADVAARLIGNILQESLGQPMVIENRPGAGGVIGTLEAARSAPDGYTLLMMSNTQTANESLVPQRKYQLMRDLVPIAPVNFADLVIVVHPSVPGHDAEGIHRAGQIAAGQAELRLVRPGHALSHGRRVV